MNDDDRHHHHHHHGGRLLSRRDMLSLLGAAGSVLVAGPSLAQPVRPALSCVVTPEQTEGPYFVDERLQRSDIRSDPTNGSVSVGPPLVLTLVVSAVGSRGCQPVAGAIVDVWHCDATGAYSDTRDPRFSTLGKKFLRGYQVTGQDGTVRFTTIYPGWYPGRAVHIHFKVRTDATSGQAHEFTSQLYFDDALTDRVHARAPYAERGRGRTRNERDGIFRDGGDRLLLPVTESGSGYAGTFQIGLRTA